MKPRKQSAGSKQRSVHTSSIGMPIQVPGGVPIERVFSNNYSPDFHKTLADVRAKVKTPFGKL